MKPGSVSEVTEQTEAQQAGPPRKYYSLTKSGKQYLGDLDAYWGDINQAISKLKKGEHS